MKYRLPIFFSFFFFLLFCSCQQKKCTIVWTSSDSKLFRDSMKGGLLLKRSLFTIDTGRLLSNEFYHSNAVLKKWEYFSMFENDSNRTSGKTTEVLFDSSGEFISLDGFFLLNSTYFKKENTLLIETINPPVKNIVIGLKDSLGNLLSYKDAFFATRTDTTAWMTFNNITFKKGHKYTIDFIVLNEKKEPMSTYSEIQDYYSIYTIDREKGNRTVLLKKGRSTGVSKQF